MVAIEAVVIMVNSTVVAIVTRTIEVVLPVRVGVSGAVVALVILRAVVCGTVSVVVVNLTVVVAADPYGCCDHVCGCFLGAVVFLWGGGGWDEGAYRSYRLLSILFFLLLLSFTLFDENERQIVCSGFPQLCCLCSKKKVPKNTDYSSFDALKNAQLC